MQTRVRVPARRVVGLATTETADEVLIYDTERHHIHHLNATTSAIWRACDGAHDVDETARLASVTLGERLDKTTVRLALTKLADANLLADPLPTDLRAARMSRRTLMRHAAIAGAIAVPAIVSTTAPAFANSVDGCDQRCPNGSSDCLKYNGTCPFCDTTTMTCQTGCGAGCSNDQVCAGTAGCPYCSTSAKKCAPDPKCNQTCNSDSNCKTNGNTYTCPYCNAGKCSSTKPAGLRTTSSTSMQPADKAVSSGQAPTQTPSPTDSPTPTPSPTPTEVPPTPTEVPPTDTPTPEPPTPTPTDVPPTDTPVPTPTPTDVPVQNLAPAGQPPQQDGGASGQSQQDTGAAGTPGSTN